MPGRQQDNPLEHLMFGVFNWVLVTDESLSYTCVYACIHVYIHTHINKLFSKCYGNHHIFRIMNTNFVTFTVSIAGNSYYIKLQVN